MNLECSSESNKFSLKSVQKNAKDITPWRFRPKKAIYSLNSNDKKGKKYQNQRWNAEENFRYALFLKNYLILMASSSKIKRKYHLYRAMSCAIQSRSPDQCRSHHQKMMRSFKSLQSVIENIQVKTVKQPQEKFLQTDELQVDLKDMNKIEYTLSMELIDSQVYQQKQRDIIDDFQFRVDISPACKLSHLFVF